MNASILIAVSVGIWWTANTITALTSKTFMRGETETDKASWSDAIKDFRWLELTFLQHLLGAVVSIMWIKLVYRKPIWPTEASKKIILIASIGNVVGNLSTNAAYAIVSSSMTQVVKACEPIFMFVLSLFLYRDKEVLNSTTLLAIVIMVIGASLFVAFDSTFLVTGLLAAICSNIAFPIRNIYLKKLSKVWDTAFQKYAILSLNSVFVLAPIVFLKLAFYQSISLLKNWQQGFFSSFCHCTYNLASIDVLQSFTPLTHAILNLLKRGIVIIANLAYFQLPISWKMVLGLAAVLLGLSIYLYRNVKGDKFSPPWVLLVLIAIALGSVFFLTSQSVDTVTPTILTTSSNPGLPSYSNRTETINDNKNLSPVELNADYSMLIHTAWVYDRPFSSEILSNFDALTKRSSVIVFCGNTHCINSIASLNNEKISAEFLLLDEVCHGTPFENWLSRHPFYKVLAQSSFEDHLQEVVRFCILLKYGGVYMDPNVQIVGNKTTPLPTCTEPWVSANDDVKHFKLACFQPQHPFLKKLSKMLVDGYYEATDAEDNSKLKVSFDNAIVTKDNYYTLHRNDFHYVLLSLNPDVPWNHHFGTLSFDVRSKHASAINLGDEIQGFPGLQFLPFLDEFLDRDNLFLNRNNDHSITAFLNAWWGVKNAAWPPQPNINPLLVSVHINFNMKRKWLEHKSYLMERGTIGCRDLGSVEILTKAHVPSYFSGCMTIMLQVRSKRTDEIIFSDVRDKYIKMLPKHIQEKGTRAYHGASPRIDNTGRFIMAFNLIERYSRAKLVITQRIHTALPCVGMGTPVIFINTPNMPGGGGSKTSSSPRTVGLTIMFHTLDLYKVTDEVEIKKWLVDFPYDNPPPNPDMATMMRLRAAFWYQIRDRPSLFDSARKFGLIPLHPPSPCKDRIQFHMLYLSPDVEFTWQDHRSIESIVRHHPCADVRIHSNTFDDKRLDVFRESGYQVNMVELDRGELFRGSKLEMYKSAIHDASEPLKSALLRAVVLYQWGGIYIDSNVVITQSLANFPPTFLVWKDASKTTIDTSFMRFTKSDNNLEKLIEKYSGEKENPKVDIFQQLFDWSDRKIEILARSQYYGQLTLEQCYKTSEFTKTLTEQISSSVAVALPTDYSVTKTIGTKLLNDTLLCTQLLRDACVFCSKLLHSV